MRKKLMSFDKSTKIYVAGHTGLAGSAIYRKLLQHGYKEIITQSHSKLDLTSYQEVEKFICNEKPSVVFLAAAKVGGIGPNRDYPADFLMNNLAIQYNVITASQKANVNRLFFMGSSCIYPKNCPQPIKEEYLLTSELEKTNQSYAIAKIAGAEMCRAFNHQFNTRYLAVMPTNLYGPNDNYNLETSHVLPALIRKIHEAKIKNMKSVEIWGTGTPKREFLHSDDLASALLHLMELDDEKFIELTNTESIPLINIGTGQDISIIDLAYLLKDIIHFDGDFIFDDSKPDGTFRKQLDVEKIKAYGWSSGINFKDGIKQTYDDFLNHFCSKG